MPISSPSRAPQRAGDAHQRGHQAQKTDDGGDDAGAQYVQRVQHAQHHAQHGAPAHGAQQTAGGLLPHQRLANEQERAAGSHEGGQARYVQLEPGVVSPQILRSQAKKVQ